MKAQRKRGYVTFYFRKDYRPVLERYMELINKDPDILALKAKEKGGVFSISIMQLMLRYIKEKKEEMQNAEAN